MKHDAIAASEDPLAKLAEVLPQPMLGAKRFLLHREKTPYYVDGGLRARGHPLDLPEDLKRLAPWTKARSHMGDAYDGLGFAIVEGDNIGLIDLDAIIQPNGELDPAHPGYDIAIDAEVHGALMLVSSSGRGLHIFGHMSGRYSPPGVEVYCSKRFAALTGNLWKGGVAKAWITLDDLPALKAHAKVPRSAVDDRSGDEGWDNPPGRKADLESALDYIIEHSPELADFYPEWTRLGMALKVAGERADDEELAKALWLRFSAASPKFKAEFATVKWEQLGTDRTGPGTFFAAAAHAGWENPKSAKRRDARDAFSDEPDEDEQPRRDKPKKAGLPIEWGEEIAPRLDAQWLVKKVLPLNGLGLIFGHPGCGKTFLALDIAGHVAMGWPWQGRPVHQGMVVYVCAEGASGARNRITAFRQRHNIEGRFPLAMVPCPVDLHKSEGRTDTERLMDAVRRAAEHYGEKPALIIVDTVSKTLGAGKENTDDMAQYVSNCQSLASEFDCCVVPVHHRPKDDASTEPRGHSSLKGGLDTVILVEGSGIRSVRITKQRDGEEANLQAFRLAPVTLGTDQDGEEVTSCTIEPLVGGLTAVTRSPLERAIANLPPQNVHGRKLLQLLGSMAASDHALPIPETIPDEEIDREVGGQVVRLADLRANFSRFIEAGTDEEAEEVGRDSSTEGVRDSSGTGSETARKAFRRWFDCLKKHGFVGFSGEWVWLTIS